MLDPATSSQWTAHSDVDVGSVVLNSGYVLLVLALYWGIQVARNVVFCTTAGVVGAWWFVPHQRRGVVAASTKRSCTTALGSICFGSLIVAGVQVRD